MVNEKLLESFTHWFRFCEGLAWFIWWYIDLNSLGYILTMVALWVYDIIYFGDLDLMSLYTQFIFQIGLTMIWLLVFFWDMCDDLLGLQVVQCCKQSILTGYIYSLVMVCLFPLIFQDWCIFKLVAWIWVVYALSHMICWLIFM